MLSDTLLEPLLFAVFTNELEIGFNIEVGNEWEGGTKKTVKLLPANYFV